MHTCHCGSKIALTLCFFGYQGVHTIVYGSSDGGRHMHKKNPIFNEKIEEIAQQLKLKAHMASNGIDLIYTPTGRSSFTRPQKKLPPLSTIIIQDLEGHMGL